MKSEMIELPEDVIIGIITGVITGIIIGVITAIIMVASLQI